MKVTELREGDHIVMYCPKARTSKRKTAIFNGIENGFAVFTQIAIKGEGGFIMGSLFRVTPNGNMEDDEGRTIYIERRIHGQN
jgi:hypothetical protein